MYSNLPGTDGSSLSKYSTTASSKKNSEFVLLISGRPTGRKPSHFSQQQPVARPGAYGNAPGDPRWKTQDLRSTHTTRLARLRPWREVKGPPGHILSTRTSPLGVSSRHKHFVAKPKQKRLLSRTS